MHVGFYRKWSGLQDGFHGVFMTGAHETEGGARARAEEEPTQLRVLVDTTEH